jgi:hypothetical protein
MIVTYGILNSDNVHIDVSNTLQGAKNYATRNDYSKVSKRVGYNVVGQWEKINSKWFKKQNN